MAPQGQRMPQAQRGAQQAATAPQEGGSQHKERRPRRNVEEGKTVQRAPAAPKGPPSPRSSGLVDQLIDLLDPLGYQEADVCNLIKRCRNDPRLVEEAVSNILADNVGHEHDSWESKPTQDFKKDKKAEAKHRREELEKRQEEDLEKNRALLKKQDDIKRKNLQEASRRRQEETANAKAGFQQDAQSKDAQSKDAQSKERKGWRTSADDEDADSKAEGAVAPEIYPHQQQQQQQEAVNEKHGENDATLEEGWVNGAEQDYLQPVEEVAASVPASPSEWSGQPAVPLPTAPPAVSPVAAWSQPAPSVPPVVDSWTSGTAWQEGSGWGSGLQSASGEHSPRELAVTPEANVRLPCSSVPQTQDDDGLVSMPASYYSLMADKQEPVIQFGTVLIDKSDDEDGSHANPKHSGAPASASCAEAPAEHSTNAARQEQRAQRGKAWGKGRSVDAHKGESNRERRDNNKGKGRDWGKGRSQGQRE